MRESSIPRRREAGDSANVDDAVFDEVEYSDEYGSDPNYIEPENEEPPNTNYRAAVAASHYRHSTSLSASDIAPLNVSGVPSKRSERQYESRNRRYMHDGEQERLHYPQWLAHRPYISPQAQQQHAQLSHIPTQQQQEMGHPVPPSQEPQIPTRYGSVQSHSYESSQSAQHTPQIPYPPPYAEGRPPMVPTEQSNYDSNQWQYQYSERYPYSVVPSQYYWPAYGYYNSPALEHKGSGSNAQPSGVEHNGRGKFAHEAHGMRGETRQSSAASSSSRRNNAPILREKVLTSNNEDVKTKLMTRENIQKYPSLVKKISSSPDAPGQMRASASGSLPKVSTAIWQAEGTICLVVEFQRTSVTRRFDNNMINGTKLLNASGITRGRRDGVLKGEKVRHVVKVGGMDFKGVWIPYERALSIAQAEGVLDNLYPLFVADLSPILQSPQNLSRIRQMLARSANRHPQSHAKIQRMLASIIPGYPGDQHGGAAGITTGSHAPGTPQQPLPPPGSHVSGCASEEKLAGYMLPEHGYGGANEQSDEGKPPDAGPSRGGEYYRGLRSARSERRRHVYREDASEGEEEYEMSEFM